jgi:AmmeMemoRadiSam system protein B
MKVRPLVDTVGFAATADQMDEVIKRIDKLQSKQLKKKFSEAGVNDKTMWKTTIAPHDDYTYTGYMYPLALKNIKAKTVILFGVAHKAAKLNLQDKLIFDSYTHWRTPYGVVKVSNLRNEILSLIPQSMCEVNDTMQKIEHSVEAEIPFLQFYNPDVEIVSILVPYMSFAKIETIALSLSQAIAGVLQRNNLKWGEDVAFVISADAVHYGDEDWGGRNFANYGVDSAGYKKAVEHEYELMNTCFKGNVSSEMVKQFTKYTVDENDFKQYKWTWCGRYSVPMGLLTSVKLSEVLYKKPLQGTILGYTNSIENSHIPVSDLGTMGVTAKANIRHWVGYAAVGFK